MAAKSRARKSRSVSASLKEGASYHSDQGEVWQEVSKLQVKACMASPTSAMSDVFKANEENSRNVSPGSPASLASRDCSCCITVRWPASTSSRVPRCTGLALGKAALRYVSRALRFRPAVDSDFVLGRGFSVRSSPLAGLWHLHTVSHFG